MLTILGIVPYAVVNVVLGTLGVGIDKWQWWAILACMIVSDGISWIKASTRN